MEGKKENGNDNGDKKAMIYEEINTEHSIIQEELQNNSQSENLELKEQVNYLFDRINQLTKEIETIQKIQENFAKIQENNTMLKNENILIKKRLRTTEKRVDALESFIIRNNINVDLLH